MTLLSTNWHKSCCTCVKAPGEGRKLRRKIKVDIKIFLTICFIISDPTSRSSFLIVWTPRVLSAWQDAPVQSACRRSWYIQQNKCQQTQLQACLVGKFKPFFWLITILDYSLRGFICTLSYVICKSFIAWNVPWHAKMKNENL